LQIAGSRIIKERSSPLGLLSVVQSPQLPLRYAPGLALTSRHEPPPQLGVFTDGDALSVITRFEGDLAPLAWLDDLTSALPYHLLTQPRVAVLGAGGGLDVLQALAQGAGTIDAVEINPQLVELLHGRYREFAGDLYRHPKVSVHIGDARGFMAATGAQFDLIQISLLDSFASAGAGTQAVSENYLYTVEALRAYSAHLREGGYLAITRWHKLPPRDVLKLVATIVSALEGKGTAADRLVLIHGWQTDTLLLRKGAFTPEDIGRVQAFCQTRGFDLAYAPGQPLTQADRFHHSEHPTLAEGVRALLGDGREAWLRDYKFNIRPATDDRPYFFHFFRWRVLPELLRLREQGSVVLLDSGYLVLIATLAQALPLSLLLILAPLAAGRLPRAPFACGRARPALYFLCLGLAFFFIEIAFIQKFILFVGHPLYAAAAVLCGFLLFAGLGSGVSLRFQARRRAVDGVVLAIALAALALLAMLPALLAYGVGWSLPLKMLLVLLLVAPLAFAMGMPFPLGLTRLAREQPALVPWAWAINGCASVLSALLATL
ncbi:MAG: spermidine synthase, partial [Nevskiales bacterium]